ncbi:hypothetical protein COU75_01275 [Candidatus Peregrinibacteria bacterium CG10_big_fil_rev_8_21_14_0_10_42_8]|nr:MAG: hypothetical protein COU75_01275 [Candidatus Peregrinibacteria bacterium CG10_big_fil_rev_8_21_14_0_10_42_8]
MKPDETLPEGDENTQSEAEVPTEETAAWYAPYIEAGRQSGVIRGEEFEEVETARQRKEAELLRRREAKEVSPHDFDLNFIFRLNEIDVPLTRKDLVHETGNQAVVITREKLEEISELSSNYGDGRDLGYVDFIHVSGERRLIESEDIREGDVLILYPEELGDEEKT